jgi:RNA polymerase sigma factor for flagellar operon FliA
MWGFAPAWRATALAALSPAQAGRPLGGLGPAEGEDRDAAGTLWQRFVPARDEAVRQALAAHYAPLARLLAARLYGVRSDPGLEFADYHHFAWVGLLECIDRFDPARGIRFESYASPHVHGTIADGVAALSERQRQASVRRQVLRERTRSLAPDTPADDKPQAAAALMADIAIGLALGFMLEDSGMFLDPQAEPGLADGTYRSAELRSTCLMVNDSLAQLAAPERRVLTLHYLQGMAFTDIAGELGLSRSRVSQLHRAGLASLQRWLRSRGLGAEACR